MTVAVGAYYEIAAGEFAGRHGELTKVVERGFGTLYGVLRVPGQDGTLSARVEDLQETQAP